MMFRIITIILADNAATLFTRWGTCAQASIGFGTHFWWMSDVGFPIVVDSHKIEY
jgi:hypothetical protein